jgi:HK97 family phage major capsid protein
MKTIKFLSGKNLNKVLEVEDLAAKSYIDDGLAVEVIPEDPMELAMKNFEVKTQEIADRVMAEATTKAIANITKGISKASPAIRVGPERELMDGTNGFKSMNHFLFEVSRSGIDCRNPTDLIKKSFNLEALRMKTAGPAGNTEGAPLSLTPGTTDGAIIPVDYATEIFKMYGDQDDFMSMAFPFPMNSLSAHLPVLRNYNFSNTAGSAGVVPYEQGEATVIPVSKTTWEQRLFTLVKESIMVPVSNEALDDNNVGLGTAIAAQAVWQLRRTINGAMIQGFSNTAGAANSNSASCYGILGTNGAGVIGGGLYTNTHTQTGPTVLVSRAVKNQIAFADIMSMYAAFAHGHANYNGAVWVGHPTICTQVSSTTIGNFPAMVVPGGASMEQGRPLSILGRPLILTGWAGTLGVTGDLMLIDFKKYIMGFKGGVNSFVSPHVYAASDQTGFRFTQRVNGQLGLTSPIILEDGATQVSPFVALGQVGGLS